LVFKNRVRVYSARLGPLGKAPLALLAFYTVTIGLTLLLMLSTQSGHPDQASVPVFAVQGEAPEASGSRNLLGRDAGPRSQGLVDPVLRRFLNLRFKTEVLKGLLVLELPALGVRDHQAPEEPLGRYRPTLLADRAVYLLTSIYIRDPRTFLRSEIPALALGYRLEPGASDPRGHAKEPAPGPPGNTAGEKGGREPLRSGSAYDRSGEAEFTSPKLHPKTGTGGGDEAGGAPQGGGGREANLSSGAFGLEAWEEGMGMGTSRTVREPGPPGKILVAVYHSHSRESFLPVLGSTGLTPSDAYSDNRELTIVRVGKELVQTLRERYQIGAVHSERQHDLVEGHGRSYVHSRNTARTMVKEYGDLEFLLDLHRDSLPRTETVTEINGEPVARIGVVIGMGKSGATPHPKWRENLKLAYRLVRVMEEKYPGLSNGIYPKAYVYNQDLSAKALLLEIGGPENTMQEELRAARLLADVLAEIIRQQASEAQD